MINSRISRIFCIKKISNDIFQNLNVYICSIQGFRVFFFYNKMSNDIFQNLNVPIVRVTSKMCFQGWQNKWKSLLNLGFNFSSCSK